MAWELHNDYIESLIVPEKIVQEVLESAINYIRNDYNNAANKQDSWLYLLFQNTKWASDISMFNTIVEVLNGDADNKKRLEVKLFFDVNRAKEPTIHITLPNEDPAELFAGQGEEDNGYWFNDGTNEFKPNYQYAQSTRFDIGITGNNPLEVILIYHLTKAILLASRSHFELSGMRDIGIGGGDITLNSTFEPQDIFIRVVNFSFKYDFHIPSLHIDDTYSDLSFSLTLDEDQ